MDAIEPVGQRAIERSKAGFAGLSITQQLNHSAAQCLFQSFLKRRHVVAKLLDGFGAGINPVVLKNLDNARSKLRRAASELRSCQLNCADHFSQSERQVANRPMHVRQITQDSEEIIQRTIVTGQDVLLPQSSAFERGEVRVNDIRVKGKTPALVAAAEQTREFA